MDLDALLEFEAPKGQRIHRYGFGIVTFTGGKWWSNRSRKWVELEDPEGGISSPAPCRTLKAFKRHLRKHAKELSGLEVVWVTRFKIHDVRIKMP